VKRLLISCAISIPLAIGVVALVRDNPTWAGFTIAFLVGWAVNAEVRKVMKP
jgi:hypothetical protein